MRYIYSFDVLKAKRDDESIKLSKLPEKLEKMGSELSNDAANYLELYTGYEMNLVMIPMQIGDLILLLALAVV